MERNAHMTERDPSSISLPQAWQAILRDAVRDAGELGRLLDLPADALPGTCKAAGEFPLLVPRGFIGRMRPGDPDDPLLRQVLPLPAEDAVAADFTDDPLEEMRYADRGMIRKYAGRALFVTTGACPVHCRYCFRRAFPYESHNAAANGWHDTLEQVRRVPDVTELILSGGDPLSLSDRKLGFLLDRIADESAIRTVRIHTRFPVIIPERVTGRLITLLKTARPGIVVVVHVNHAQEIDAAVAAALAALKESTTALLNQSVLLRGVNDEAATLVALSERLFDCGVLPYYLHQLDRVTGTQHFAVDDARAVELMDEIRSLLPGYLVPRLVREEPGQLSKTPVGMGPALP